MTCPSTGSKTKIGLIPEATFGVIPSTPALQALPFASATFTLSQDEILDARLDGERDVSDITFGNKQIAADISADFSATDYDTLIESFLFNPLSTGTIGTTLKSFTMEEAQTDVGLYRKFTGLVANTMSLEAPIDGNATITFGLIGKEEGYTLGVTTATDSLDPSGYDPAVFDSPFRHVNGTVSDKNGSMLGIVQSISLSGDNAIDPSFVWGKDTVDCMVAKKVQITGSVTIYYVSETQVNEWIQGDSTSITFSLTDGTSTYTFTMDKVYYTGADMGVADDGIRTITLPFRAVNSANTSLKITKS